VLSQAQTEIAGDWEKAKNFQHKGVRGGWRESAVRQFLASRLPSAYSVVTTGEAVDCGDARTAALDVIIYDHTRNAPLLSGEGTVLLPAEALLAVVEVKSTLTVDELRKCYCGATSVRALQPYKKRFTAARPDGRSAEDGLPRCFYSVFAFTSNLSAPGWLTKQWKRIDEVAASSNCNPDSIDRILVLDRGLIMPVYKKGQVTVAAGADVLLTWFLHLSNFLARENAIRQPVDLEMYAGRNVPGTWEKL
jgi:hypothetical protein